VIIWVVVALVLLFKSALADHTDGKKALAHALIDKEDHSSFQALHTFDLIICFTWFEEKGTDKVNRGEGD
jgi:hypothetical protein